MQTPGDVLHYRHIAIHCSFLLITTPTLFVYTFPPLLLWKCVSITTDYDYTLYIILIQLQYASYTHACSVLDYTYSPSDMVMLCTLGLIITYITYYVLRRVNACQKWHLKSILRSDAYLIHRLLYNVTLLLVLWLVAHLFAFLICTTDMILLWYSLDYHSSRPSLADWDIVSPLFGYDCLTFTPSSCMVYLFFLFSASQSKESPFLPLLLNTH